MTDNKDFKMTKKKKQDIRAHKGTDWFYSH